MDLSNIYELWDRFDASDVVEMELKMEGVHFHLKTSSYSEEKEFGQYVPAERAEAPVMKRPAEETMAKNIEKIEDQEEKMMETKVVKAPLVGTFYQAPSPDAAPFVEIGQEIHKGDVIGIIEAMKLMNEVVADSDGIVHEILVEDGMMVEYDQPLITIR